MKSIDDPKPKNVGISGGESHTLGLKKVGDLGKSNKRGSNLKT